MWQHWLNFLMGLWVVLSAYIISAENLAMNFTISGIVIAVLAIWGALRQSMMMSNEHMHRHA